MAYITWKTKAGSIGVVSAAGYIEIPLAAVSSSGAALEFTHIAGTLPIGIEVAADGRVKGVPVLNNAGASVSVTSSFTVRANTPDGTIADRTFSVTVNNYSPIKIDLASGVIGSFNDGSKISYQFRAISDNPNPDLTWSIVDGDAPIDLLTLKPINITSSGLFEGYLGRFTEYDQPTGYDEVPLDLLPYHFKTSSQNKSYTFTVRVTDGAGFDAIPVRIDVFSKSSFTSDITSVTIDTVLMLVDGDNRYVPIIMPNTETVPTLTVDDKFSFKFNAIDPEGDVVYWRVESPIATASISTITGWLTGTVPPQSETQKDQVFKIYAYKRDTPEIHSTAFEFKITTVKDSTNFITWLTSSDLGTMTNGAVSEYAIQALNNAGKELNYSLVAGSLPVGLELLNDGIITGRSSFRYFSIDGNSASITVANTSGIVPGMIVQGPGVASGSKVISVSSANTLKISPATYVNEGVDLTFSNSIGTVNITTQLTDLSTTTSIDGGKTTFDDTYKFTVKAAASDYSVSDVKEFTVKIVNYNRAPYENLYLRALLARDQRDMFLAAVSNKTIFPLDQIYRPKDPNFGLSTTIKMLFAAGITASSLSDIALSIGKNHYNKTINFGNIKTARAVDSNLNTVYEVVYIEVTDNNAGASLVGTPSTSVDYAVGSAEYSTIYPNSFDNMQYRIATGVGYSNRGALPAWMTSRQTDGTVLGLVRAVVLAYTVPGASEFMAFRLRNSGITFNDIHFVADRYYVDAGATANYSTATNNFFSGAVDDTDKYIKFTQYGVYI